jgi:hypothetical protein
MRTHEMLEEQVPNIGQKTWTRELQRLRCNLEDSIKMYLTEMRFEVVGWIHLA